MYFSCPQAAALHAGSEALEPGRSPEVGGARRGCRGAWRGGRGAWRGCSTHSGPRAPATGAAVPGAPSPARAGRAPRSALAAAGATGDKRQQEPGSESNKRCSTSCPDRNLHAKQTLSAMGFWYQAINKTFTQLEILVLFFSPSKHLLFPLDAKWIIVYSNQ